MLNSKLRYFMARTLPWVPDVTFASASSRVDLAPLGDADPFQASQFMRAYENGDCHYSQLIELVVPVEFSIQFFPFEIVSVVVLVESYGFTKEAVVLTFNNDTLDGLETVKVRRRRKEQWAL